MIITRRLANQRGSIDPPSKSNPENPEEILTTMSDFTKVCKSCGAQLPSDSSKCFNCGTVLEWKRHGFVSFWLWLSVIASVLGIIAYVVLGDEAATTDEYLYSLYGSGWDSSYNNNFWDLAEYYYWHIPVAILLSIGYALLINWKKIGFWTIVLAQTTSLIVGIYFMTEGLDSALLIISPIFALIVLIFILQIKRDDVSYWKAMTLKSKWQKASAGVASATPSYGTPAQTTYTAPAPAPAPIPTPAYKYTTPMPEPAPAPAPIPVATEYWVGTNGQKYGPYNMLQMKEMAQKGQINSSMLVWKPGMEQWEVANNIPELKAMFTQTPPPFPPVQ